MFISLLNYEIKTNYKYCLSHSILRKSSRAVNTSNQPVKTVLFWTVVLWTNAAEKYILENRRFCEHN